MKQIVLMAFLSLCFHASWLKAEQSVTGQAVAGQSVTGQSVTGQADSKKLDHFVPEAFEIEDQFKVDSLGQYKTSGDIDYSFMKVTLNPKSTLAIVKTLDANLRIELDLWPNANSNVASTTRLNLLVSNDRELIFVISRAKKEGRLYRQVIVSEALINRKDPKKSIVNVLRRSPIFSIKGEAEKWSLRYNMGSIQLTCNNQNLASVYSDAFSSWVRAVVISQFGEKVGLSRLSFSGETVGYSTTQRKLYEESNLLERQTQELTQQGALDKAVDIFSSIISIREKAFGANDFSLGLTRRNLAGYYKILEEKEKTTKELRVARDIFEKALGKSHPETLSTDAEYLISKLAEDGDYDSAEASLRPLVTQYAKIAADKSGTTEQLHIRLRYLLDTQAKRANSRKNYSKAMAYRKEILQLTKLISDEESESVLNAKHELEFQTSIADSEGKERAALIDYLELNAKIMQLGEEGETVAAMRLHDQLLTVARKVLPDSSDRFISHLCSESIFLFNRGEIVQAVSLLQEAQASLEREDRDEGDLYTNVICHLGANLSMIGHFEDASKLLYQADDFHNEHSQNNSFAYAKAKLELGRHLIRIGKPDKALIYLTDAMASYSLQGLPSCPDALATYERIADVYRASGRINEAEYYLDYQRKLTGSVYGKDNIQYLQILTSEGVHLLMRGKSDEAVKKYEAALVLAEKHFGKNSRANEPIFEGLIQAHLQKGDVRSAIRCFEEVLEYEIQRRENLFGIYSEEGQLLKMEESLVSLDALLVLALNGQIEPKRAYDLAAAFKGAVTSRQRSQKAAQRTPASRKLIEELDQVSKLLNQKDLPPQQSKSLQREQDAIVRQLSDTTIFRIASKRYRTKEIQDALPNETVLIDFFEYIKPSGFFEDKFKKTPKLGMLAFVLPAEGEIQLIDLGEAVPILESLASWRLAMNAEPIYARIKEEDKSVAELTDRWGAVVRQKLWDPLAPHLSSAKTIVISPSVNLTACPFAAMPSDDGNAFLIERFALSSISASRLIPELLAEREIKTPPKLLLVGDINYDAKLDGKELNQENKAKSIFQFSQLKLAEEELEPIKNAFQMRDKKTELKVLMSEEASEANVVNQIEDASYIHFHTHGFYLPIYAVDDETNKKNRANSTKAVTGFLSGIALAGANNWAPDNLPENEDGLLLSYELENFDLSKAELVTLSACETGLGKSSPGEGMLGAQRSLHIAGAKASLAALWAVEDQSTRELMSSFYTKMMIEKLPKAKAMQQTMIEMRQNYNWKPNDENPYGQRMPPALWSGFVLYGDWR